MSTTQEDNEQKLDIKENTSIATIHRIYRSDISEELVIRDAGNRRSFVNKSAYAKLHRSLSTGHKRHSVDNLKDRFESFTFQKPIEGQKEVAKLDTINDKVIDKEEEPVKFTPASFGYPKTAKLTPPLIKPKPAIKPKPVIRKQLSKDENSNVVKKHSTSSDGEEINIILRPTASQESVDKIAKELSSFEMDGKTKDKKRGTSFRKFLMGSLFSKDKKKKEEEKNKSRHGDTMVYNDNIKNESNFTRGSSLRQTVSLPVTNHRDDHPNNHNDQEVHEERVKELEQKYAALHVHRFKQIREEFGNERTQEYIPMDQNKKKTTITDYISTPINKYIDTSSTASTESEKMNGIIARETPPRAQETQQSLKIVKPKATIPISSERPLPNPYQNEKNSPRTIERNLNRSNGKDYPDKPHFASEDNNVYGTVYDAHSDFSKTPVTPKSPSLENTKLKLPPNREIYDLQPRVRSPLPSNRVSTEKIIATEILRNNTRSPTPPKRNPPKPPERNDLPISRKPPLSPKIVSKPDQEVTNVLVHNTSRSQTPVDNRTYINMQQMQRSTTPVNLRAASSLKTSPQKQDIRKSVEEYYWKELKKMKEEEDSKLMYSFDMNGFYDESARVRRSRSLSPHRISKRSLSLPRDGSVNYVDYGRFPPHQAIPEDHTLITDDRHVINRRIVSNPNYSKNVNVDGRQMDGFHRPIFRRGSLTKQEIYENQPYNKRVSFSSSQVQRQQWPTRNGYTQTPPQRRIDRVDSELEDDVFIPPEPVYVQRFIQEPVYSNRVLDQFRAQQYYENMRRQQLIQQQQRHQQQQQQLHQQQNNQIGPRRSSMDSLPKTREEIYISRQVVPRPVSNVPDQYGRINTFQQYPSNSQLSLQVNPMYSSRQSITDNNYGQKQVTMSNKYCDIYGQIHDTPSSQTGIVMGQLQEPKVVPRVSYLSHPENFVRGSRLTASANDIGRRQLQNPNGVAINYDNRPLPPTPPSAKKAVRSPISDTESGSDASEIQRIMQNKTKSKKRGLFGK